MSEYGRVRHSGRVFWVKVEEGRALPLSGPPWETPEPALGTAPLAADGLAWLPPVEPGKVIGIGRNYALHAQEHGAEVPKEPLIFLKAPTSVLANGEDVVLPPESSRVEYEGELALVFGRRVRRFPADGDLASVLLGYACADDVTARDLQRADGQWARGKSFDTFCPLSRLVTTIRPAPDARIETRINGETRQAGRLSDLVFSLERLVAHVSAAMTLLPGDVLLTGTPAGVGPLAPGDRVEVTVEGVPALSHGVRAESA